MHTNHVECFFAEMRRYQAGTYRRFGLGYLQYYAAELGWRLEIRDKPNGLGLENLARRVLRSGASIQLADVWNKRPRAKNPRPKVQKPASPGYRLPHSGGHSVGCANAAPASAAQAQSRDKPRADSNAPGPAKS